MCVRNTGRRDLFSRGGRERKPAWGNESQHRFQADSWLRLLQRLRRGGARHRAGGLGMRLCAGSGEHGGRRCRGETAWLRPVRGHVDSGVGWELRSPGPGVSVCRGTEASWCLWWQHGFPGDATSGSVRPPTAAETPGAGNGSRVRLRVGGRRSVTAGKLGWE